MNPKKQEQGRVHLAELVMERQDKQKPSLGCTPLEKHSKKLYTLNSTVFKANQKNRHAGSWTLSCDYLFLLLP